MIGFSCIQLVWSEDYSILGSITITGNRDKQNGYKPISYYTILIKTYSAGKYSWTR